LREIDWPRGALPLLTLALCAVVLAFPRPLRVNLGAGDEPLARGFQDWERAGPDGRTMFRWSRDGSTIELPVSTHVEHLAVRVRLARFLPEPIVLTWRVNGRDAHRQTIRPRGWRVETLDLGRLDGPVLLELRSFDDKGALGAAIDWVEISDVNVRPRRRAVWHLLLLVIVAPMMAGFIAGTRAGNVMGYTLLIVVPAALWLDAGLAFVMVTKAALPTLLALIALATISRLPGEFHSAFSASAVVATIALLALLHPSFYYPDVDTHARLLDAIREDPSLAVDPSPYQQRTGAWMRTIAGAKVAFPYSPAFHVVAWPLALFFGETDAIKILAAVAIGASTLLLHGLARRVGMGLTAAVLAQVLFACLPVQSSRLCLALFPALFAQALELALLTLLAVHLPALGMRGAGVLALAMMATQLAYTGALPNVAAVVAALTCLLYVQAERTAAARVLVAGTVSTLVVAAVLYARFLPVLWTQVLPHATGAADPDPAGPWTRTLGRALHFLGPYALLAVLGFRSLTDTATRRVVAAAAVAGAALLVLRGPLPFLVRDVKEIELLSAPVALFSAAALARMSTRPQGRYAAIAIAAGLAAWGLVRAVGAYQADLYAADL
jgi:hypothetical protein